MSPQNNILILWLKWHFFEIPKGIITGWRNILKFNLHFFSIPFLAKTLFAPWHRYLWSYGKGFDPWRYFEVFISNLMSRFLAAIMRSFLIILGLLAEIFLAFAGLIIVIGWTLLPLLLIAGLITGLTLLF